MANRIVAIDWLDSHDVHLINDSETPGYRDSVNDAIRNKWITIVHAAGNQIPLPKTPVGCYVNALCVGNMHNTSASWVDWWKADPGNQFGIYAMSTNSSSWVDDPAQHDAEKPDVVAIGGPGLPRYPRAYAVTTITLQPAQSVRAVLGWMFCVDPNADPTTFLATDFDLHLFDGLTEVDSSRSYTNSLEMLEYTNGTTSTRTVTLVITQYGVWKSCLGSSTEYAGVSWVRHVGGTPAP